MKECVSDWRYFEVWTIMHVQPCNKYCYTSTLSIIWFSHTKKIYNEECEVRRRDWQWRVRCCAVQVPAAVSSALRLTVTCTLLCRAGDRGCELGVAAECVLNEECVALNNRARSGRCECVDGYRRDAKSGICQPSPGTGSSVGSVCTCSMLENDYNALL